MYKFIFEDTEKEQNSIFDSYHTKRVEFQVRDNSSLDEMLDAFENFLKANGYEFDGNVDIVPEDSFDAPDFEKGWPFYDAPVFEKGYPSYDAVDREMEIDPDKREWEYDCEGNKVVKGDFTKLYKPKKKLWDATPEEWNAAFKSDEEKKNTPYNVTMKTKYE
jgi:hypothetical protein